MAVKPLLAAGAVSGITKAAAASNAAALMKHVDAMLRVI
jgi:hypothetical protein